MQWRWNSAVCRSAAVMFMCIACCAVMATPALASSTGQTWLDWVYEPAGAGIHAKWYNYFEQEASDVSNNNWSCSNGWYGSRGSWVWGSDYCAIGEESATPQITDPGVGAYPWAQSEYTNTYLWGWARYCNNC